MRRRKLALLAGAREAHALASVLVAAGAEVRACLSEPSRLAPLPVPTHVASAEPADGLSAWLAADVPDRVIDAGHPFDAGVTAVAQQACKTLGIPYLRLLRPAWQAQTGDCWTGVGSIPEAVAALPPEARVFANTGRATVDDWRDFEGTALILRIMETPATPPPFTFMTYLPASPPFTLEDERAMLRDNAITHLVCRNTGGVESRAKLEAARSLGCQVLMIARPAAPPGAPVVASVAEARDWALAP
ncbi:precorrin-6A/cobalt-precorrin-6A reductase [Sulfitobacter sp. D35]|uniref:precorrin-6A/cobalt-precorrin-6A reductase n=1 Tax=Sulfitobacter sp. D35 TaxID=3083252 RepID=UPI00296FC793|nr:precorrin-6A/cobalt-precorrin-6A reductase [Sulfitobacter sp. D35]MDW4497566.1 precorrin-6A/cobalt-precorrin-6A reductase [Sulfitobacter sp. D35]